MDFMKVGTSPDSLVSLPAPVDWGVTIQEISSSDAGRSSDGLMHKDVVAKKRSLSPTWNNLDGETTAAILQAFDPVYVWVWYRDPLTNSFQLRQFYTGDKNAKMRQLTIYGVEYSSLSFSVIER